MSRAAHTLVGLSIAFATACSGGDPVHRSDAGATYPNRRPTFPREGRTLGYVANRGSDSVSVLDLDALAELGSAPVGRDPVDNDGPRHVLVDADAGLLYLVLTYPTVATSPHAAANATGPRAGYVEAVSLDDLSILGALRVATSPSDLALSNDRSVLAVVHDDPNLVVAASANIDARRAPFATIAPAAGVATNAAALTQSPVCVAPTSVVLAGEERAFVACSGEDTLAVLDTTTNAVVSRVAAGVAASNQPYALVRDTAGLRLALSNRIARTVVVFSVEDSPHALATVSVPGTPFFAGFLANGELVVPLQNPSGAALVDPQSGAVLKSTRYLDTDCENPSEAQELDDGRLFLVCEGDHYGPGAVVSIDPTSLALVGRVEVGVYPDRLAVLPP